MKNRGAYILAAALAAVILALAVAAISVTSSLPPESLYQFRLIFIAGGIAMVAVIGFFIWLAAKGK